jgi:hypothetical protein
MGNRQKAIDLVRTKWRLSAKLRMRMCLECREYFPSAGPESRFCPKCLRRIDEARARLACDSPAQLLLAELEDWFDPEIAERAKQRLILDTAARLRRRQQLSN